MIPPESGFDRRSLISPAVMAPPIVWLCSDAADGITGNRYIAAKWDTALPPETAERRCRAPAGWPGLGPPMLSTRSASLIRYAASWLRSILRLMCSPALIVS